MLAIIVGDSSRYLRKTNIIFNFSNKQATKLKVPMKLFLEKVPI